VFEAQGLPTISSTNVSLPGIEIDGQERIGRGLGEDGGGPVYHKVLSFKEMAVCFSLTYMAKEPAI